MCHGQLNYRVFDVKSFYKLPQNFATICLWFPHFGQQRKVNGFLGKYSKEQSCTPKLYTCSVLCTLKYKICCVYSVGERLKVQELVEAVIVRRLKKKYYGSKMIMTCFVALTNVNVKSCESNQFRTIPSHLLRVSQYVIIQR